MNGGKCEKKAVAQIAASFDWKRMCPLLSPAHENWSYVPEVSLSTLVTMQRIPLGIFNPAIEGWDEIRGMFR